MNFLVKGCFSVQKRGQLEIQESTLIIFIFTIILLIGLSIFYRYTVDSIKADNEDYYDFRFKAGISSIPSMAEVSCSFLGEQKECVDLEKARAFSLYSKDYFYLFGYSNITLYVVYPSGEGPVLIYYRRPEVSKQLLTISTSVLVYDAFDSDFKAGKLVLVRYK